MDKALLRKLKGKHPIEVYKELTGITTKRDLLRRFNQELGTNYNVNHLNNWLAGRKAMPDRLRGKIRLRAVESLFGRSVAKGLENLLD